MICPACYESEAASSQRLRDEIKGKKSLLQVDGKAVVTMRKKKKTGRIIFWVILLGCGLYYVHWSHRWPWLDFRFEDYWDYSDPAAQRLYKTSQQGIEDLKHLHPVGSPLVPLLRTLTRAGASCYETKLSGTVCELIKHNLILVESRWIISLRYDEKGSLKYKPHSVLIDLDSELNKKFNIVEYVNFSMGYSYL